MCEIMGYLMTETEDMMTETVVEEAAGAEAGEGKTEEGAEAEAETDTVAEMPPLVHLTVMAVDMEIGDMEIGNRRVTVTSRSTPLVTKVVMAVPLLVTRVGMAVLAIRVVTAAVTPKEAVTVDSKIDQFEFVV